MLASRVAEGAPDRKHLWRRGTVTISPTPVFTLFTNSSQQQYADAHLKASEARAEPPVPQAVREWPKLLIW